MSTEEQKEQWLNENAHISSLLGPWIISLRPDIGYFIKVDTLDIPKDIFPEEFEKITTAYFEVLEKLKKHRKDNI